MNKKNIKYMALLLGSALLNNTHSFGQADTLHVMAYNVLYYGDRPACQGPHNAYHNYLKTIVSYTNPDILGLEKMAAIPMFTGDNSGSAPAGFADSILQFALNAAFANRYAYCTYTNTSTADNVSVLFYNKQKLGFAGILSSYVNITDFNTYKLYYRSADLATTHDTIFLYVTLNHTQSGSGSSSISDRAAQISGEMNQIQTYFTQLPNFINMGDFNFHASTEAGYQTLVAPANPAFKMYDPPFYPDATYTYPADWDSNPGSYAASLTTSTRLSGSIPNSCGTSGGGKSWYDHLFLSGAIVNNTKKVSYIPHSYRTIGNDGNRTSISINDVPVNSSAPSTVIEALFQMSNKYPVMVDLRVDPSATAVAEKATVTPVIKVANPVDDRLQMHLEGFQHGTLLKMHVIDVTGKTITDNEFATSGNSMSVPINLKPGLYCIRFSCGSDLISVQTVVKE